MEQLIISLVAGAVGGNLAGVVLKKLSLGTLGNSIVGILGGGIGAQIFGMLGMAGAAGGSAFEISTLIASVASGGVGGAVLLAIVGAVRGMMAKA